MVGAQTIERKLNVTPAISSQMEEAIQLWADMYKNQSPWLNEPTPQNPVRVTSLGLPAMIASEKARMVLLEFKSEITVPTKEVEIENPNYVEPKPDEFGNIIPSAEPKIIVEERMIGDDTRAKFLATQYAKLKRQLRKQLEYGIAKGGLVIKPFIVFTKLIDENGQEKQAATMEFDFVQADSFYPIAFNAANDIVEAAFIESKIDGNIIYRRLEYHKWEGNTVRIVNRAFMSTDGNTSTNTSSVDLGKEIPLTDVPEWKDLQATTIIRNVTRPLFAYFKMPEANTIDTSSPLGVSGYSRAVNLIKDADMQYSRLLWEYEAGEMAINVQRDAFKYLEDPANQNQHTVLGRMQERLYRQIDVDENDLFQEYAPMLRDNAFNDGLNTILMRIEDVCGISRGTLSDAANEARTATELKILKQRSYQTNAEIQTALEDTLRDAIYVMDVYCTLYNITPPGEYDVSFEWDDSIIIDVDEELNKRVLLLNYNLSSRLETRMWYFGETERQAAEALAKIDEETIQQQERDLVMQSKVMQSNMGGNNNQFSKYSNSNSYNKNYAGRRDYDNPDEE